MAGSVPTIKTRLEADVDGFIANVKKAGQAGEQAMRQIKTAGGAVADGGRLANGQLQRMALHGLEAERAGNRLREAFHVAHPILETAGLGLGNLGSFARLASGSLAGLGVAIGGALLVGLEKISDHSARLKKGLTDLGGSDKDFAALRKSATETGISVDDLVTSYKDVRKARGEAGGASFVTNPYGPPIKEINPKTGERVIQQGGGTQAIPTLAKLVSLGAGNVEDATKDLHTITAGLAESGGRLTGKTAEQLSAGSARQIGEKVFGLPALPPGSLLTPQQQLERYLGPQGRSLNELQPRLNQIAPQVDKDFAAKGPGDLSDAFAHLKTATEELVGDFHLLAGPIEALAKLIERLAPKGPSKEEHDEQFKNRFRPRLAPETQATRLTDEEFQALPSEEKFRRRFEPRGLPKQLQGILPVPQNAIIEPPAIPAGVPPPAATTSLPSSTAAVADEARRVLSLQGITDGGRGSTQGAVGFVPASSQGTIGPEPKPLSGGNVGGDAASASQSGAIIKSSLEAGAQSAAQIAAALRSAAPQGAPQPSASPPGKALGGLIGFAHGGRINIPRISIPGFAEGGSITPGHTVFGNHRVELEAPATGTATFQYRFDPVVQQQHASGGPIRGAGTGTSDSILARLSHGEFVVNAKAAEKHLPLLDAINSHRYADGGMVKVGKHGLDVIDGYAKGGTIGDFAMPSSRQSPLSSSSFSDRGRETPSSMQPAHIHFGTRSVGPVHGSPDVIGALQREASDYLDAQGARRPSWDR